MTVETNANFIGDLNESYPTQRDLINEGDDHIRLVKAVLKKTFPGMDKAVNFTSDKLNKLNDTLVYGEDGLLKINDSLELKSGVTTDFGGAVLSNVGDPKEPTDAVNLQSLQGKLMWPIGSIYMSISSDNPKDIFGFGKWEKFAEGRVIIGSGSGTDVNNISKIFTNEKTGGEYEHKIVEGELPKHTHTIEGTAKEDGEHQHSFQQLQIAGPSPDTKHGSPIAQYGMTTYQTDLGGKHTHELEGKTDGGSGGEKGSNIIQPYVVCNIWKRTE